MGSRGTKINAYSGILNIEPSSYFVERDGDAFRSFFASTLKLGHLLFDENASDVTEGDTCRVLLVTKPELGAWIPSSLRSRVDAAEIEFHDEIVYRRDDIESPPYVLHVRTSSPFLKERFRLESTLSLTPVVGEDGAVGCIQRLQGHVEVHMMGLGGLIQRMVRDSVHNTYKKLPSVIEGWLVERERMLQCQGGQSALLHGRPVGIDCGVRWIQTYPLESEEEIPHVKPLEQKLDDGEEPITVAVPSPGVFMVFWLRVIDACKLIFIVTILVCMRFRVIKMTRRARPLDRRSISSWAAAVPHRKSRSRTASQDMSEAEKLVQSVHFRRPSYSSVD
ncbi:hypothetical protein M9434_004787 [Picochlorum sp. BPE23]|nr:hypothetical protein M9434_004787 [Picochlorum sp. BPE23]